MIYDQRNKAELGRLDYIAKLAFMFALKDLEEKGLEYLITDGYRSEEEQNRLYAKGRTEEGDIVTYVTGGYSFHNHGLAIDIVPVDIDGNILWKYEEGYREFAKVARKYGIDWGFDLWNFDKPHFQYTQGFDINHFRTGGTLNESELTYDIRSPFWRPSYQVQIKNARRALKRASPSRRRKLERKIKRLQEKLMVY